MNNKANISEFSKLKEKEILLYPYFHFKLLKNIAVNVKAGNIYKNICQIEVEEIPIKIFDFRIFWL